MIAAFCDGGKQLCLSDALHLVQMNGSRSSTTSRRTAVGSGSRTHVFIGEHSINFRTSSAVTTSKLVSCVPLYRLNDGGGAFSVTARTPSTLSVKN